MGDIHGLDQPLVCSPVQSAVVSTNQTWVITGTNWGYVNSWLVATRHTHARARAYFHGLATVFISAGLLSCTVSCGFANQNRVSSGTIRGFAGWLRRALTLANASYLRYNQHFYRPINNDNLPYTYDYPQQVVLHKVRYRLLLTTSSVS